MRCLYCHHPLGENEECIRLECRTARASAARRMGAHQHCEGCDTPQPDVQRCEWKHHGARGVALWCADCRAAATAVVFGAFAGGERTIISTRRA